MTRALFLLAVTLAGALPVFAQSTEFGFIIGASRRFVENGQRQNQADLLDSDFALSNSAVELYWGIDLPAESTFKIKVGRIESPVAFNAAADNETTTLRKDVEGEVQYISTAVDYRFDEPYGSTGIFGGVGFYRQSGPGYDSTSNFGYSVGANADFPLSRRYGVVVETAYHWVRDDFRPRYFTLGAGLRIAF